MLHHFRLASKLSSCSSGVGIPPLTTLGGHGDGDQHYYSTVTAVGVMTQISRYVNTPKSQRVDDVGSHGLQIVQDHRWQPHAGISFAGSQKATTSTISSTPPSRRNPRQNSNEDESNMKKKKAATSIQRPKLSLDSHVPSWIRTNRSKPSSQRRYHSPMPKQASTSVNSKCKTLGDPGLDASDLTYLSRQNIDRLEEVPVGMSDEEKRTKTLGSASLLISEEEYEERYKELKRVIKNMRDIELILANLVDITRHSHHRNLFWYERLDEWNFQKQSTLNSMHEYRSIEKLVWSLSRARPGLELDYISAMIENHRILSPFRNPCELRSNFNSPKSQHGLRRPIISSGAPNTEIPEHRLYSTTCRQSGIPYEKDMLSIQYKSNLDSCTNLWKAQNGHMPLVYQIPDAILQEKLLAPANTGTTFWQYNLYRGPEGQRVKVHYCRSKTTTERIAQLFLEKEVIGFDIEWKPQSLPHEGIKKNVSLIQLASEERIALFHIARFAEDNTIDAMVAPSLKKILESPEITKVGVSVKADCTRLRRHMGINSRALFELSHLYKLVRFSTGEVKKINKKLVSLSQQVEEHLRLPLWKGEVRGSNWSEQLTYEQIQYAASDSYAGLQLYHVLEGKRNALNPIPPRPAHAELNLPIRLASGQTVATYDELDELEEEFSAIDSRGRQLGIEQMARDFINTAIEDIYAPGSTNPPKSTPPSFLKCSEIIQAEQWVRTWRSSLPADYKPRTTNASLRAFALWAYQGKEVSEVATLLRDPPLQHRTVATYILTAVKMEKLPFDEQRLRLVLDMLPSDVVGERYKALRRLVEDSDTEEHVKSTAPSSAHEVDI